MRTSSSFNQFEKESCKITIGGKSMTIAEYNNAYNKPKTTKKAERRQKFIQQIAPYIKKLVKSVKVLKSLAAYYDNGYRQWGVVCRDNIINHPYISGPFIQYRISAYEMAQLIDKIDKIGRKNEKDIFQFIEKLSYKTDDAKKHINNLVHAVDESNVCEFYKDEKCINETGRRLGLSVLMYKALISMNEIDGLIKELNELASTGVDVFDYNGNNNKRYYIR